jgi:hypothetical protein
MEANPLLTELSERLDIGGMRLDALAGVLYLPSGNDAADISIRLVENGMLRLHADLGTLPQSDWLAWCICLLAFNLFSENAGGGTFALDMHARAQLLRDVRLTSGCDSSWLRGVVQRFAAAAADFRGKVEAALADCPSADGLPTPLNCKDPQFSPPIE